MDPVTRLWRRSLQIVGIGRGSTAVTDGGAIRTAQLTYTSIASQADGVPFMQHYGFASRPHAGCDHLTVSLSGDLGRAAIIASNDQRYRMPLEEGESAIHDDLGQFFHVMRTGLKQQDRFGNSITSSSSGWTIADFSGNTIVTSPAGITLTPCTGIVYVAGELQGTEESSLGASFTGTIKTTADVIGGYGTADQVSLLGHEHDYLPGSGASTPTSPPIPGT